jgi:hypothetical protein
MPCGNISSFKLPDVAFDDSNSSTSAIVNISATIASHVADLPLRRARTWDESCMLLSAGIWPITADYKAGVSFLMINQCSRISEKY